ncbi:MAG: HEAT repeat domain-containing protein, partial [Planctomycetota bacterium]
FRRRFRHTPLWRAHRRGLLRNAAIVLGNAGDAAAVAPLVKGLHDEEPLVRSACAWALGRIDADSARDVLRKRAASESDPDVMREIAAALDSG